jgi:hypothetical protein
MIKKAVLYFLALVGFSPLGVACVDPLELSKSTVSIMREFSEPERQANPAVLGIRGTGWFISSSTMVTASHVAEAMRLSYSEWKDVEIRGRDSKQTISARIQRTVGFFADRLAVLELKTMFPDSMALTIRVDELVVDEDLSSLAYPNGELRVAKGKFKGHGTSLLLEMYDGSDRLVLDHGASGAPVFDCNGHVVATVGTLITQTLQFPTGTVRVSTPWHTPNVLAIPVEELTK